MVVSCCRARRNVSISCVLFLICPVKPSNSFASKQKLPKSSVSPHVSVRDKTNCQCDCTWCSWRLRMNFRGLDRNSDTETNLAANDSQGDRPWHPFEISWIAACCLLDLTPFCGTFEGLSSFLSAQMSWCVLPFSSFAWDNHTSHHLNVPTTPSQLQIQWHLASLPCIVHAPDWPNLFFRPELEMAHSPPCSTRPAPEKALCGRKKSTSMIYRLYQQPRTKYYHTERIESCLARFLFLEKNWSPTSGIMKTILSRKNFSATL